MELRPPSKLITAWKLSLRLLSHFPHQEIQAIQAIRSRDEDSQDHYGQLLFERSIPRRLWVRGYRAEHNFSRNPRSPSVSFSLWKPCEWPAIRADNKEPQMPTPHKYITFTDRAGFSGILTRGITSIPLPTVLSHVQSRYIWTHTQTILIRITASEFCQTNIRNFAFFTPIMYIDAH